MSSERFREGSIAREEYPFLHYRIGGLKVHKLEKGDPTTFFEGEGGEISWRNPVEGERYEFGYCNVCTLTTETGGTVVVIPWSQLKITPHRVPVFSAGVVRYPPLVMYELSSRWFFSLATDNVRVGESLTSQPVGPYGFEMRKTGTGELPTVSVLLEPIEKTIEEKLGVRRDPEWLVSLIKKEGLKTVALKLRIPEELLRYAYFRRKEDLTWLNAICQATSSLTSWGPRMLEVITRLPLPSEVDTFARPSRNPFEALRKIQEYTPTVRWTIPVGM